MPARQDTDGAQKGLRGCHYRQGHTRRPVLPSRLRRQPPWEIVSSALSSGQAFQEALSQDDELLSHGKTDFFAEDIVAALCDLLQQPPVDGHQYPKSRPAVLVNERNQLLARIVVFARTVSLSGKDQAQAGRIGC